MTASQEYKGKWWLPGKEEDKVSGVLTYIPGETIELELIGNFAEAGQDPLTALSQDDRVKVIYGQASDGSDISLFDCGSTIHRTFKADFAMAKYFPRQIAIGIHIPSVDDKRFFKAVVRIPELSYWLYPKVLEQMYLKEDNKFTAVNVKMSRLPENERIAAKTSVNNGFTISLRRDATHNSSDLCFTTTFEQFTSLTLESRNEESLRRFYEKVVRYERFLTVATLRDVHYSELLLFSEDSYKTIGKDNKIYNPIRFDTIFHEHENYKKIQTANFLFNYNNMEEKYSAVLKKWYSRDSKFDAIRGHFLEAIDYNGHFSYMNFLTVIQAIEGYGWRYRKDAAKATANIRCEKAKKKGTKNPCKEITLADIITSLVDEFKDVSCINKRINVSAVTDSRNYYSHLTEKTKKHKLDGEKLFDLTNELRKILLCCVLSYLGFANQEIEIMTRDCNHSLIKGYK